ncbi:MAG: GlsB/YeaQ/YmgE family stress response membrane protein [Acidimicrobiales bacterium]
MLGFIIVMLIIGLIAGFVARALVPGDDSMSIVATILLGIVGSFVGGFLADVLFRSDAEDVGIGPSGLLGSIVGAIVVLLIYNAVADRRRGGLPARRRGLLR